MQESGDAPQNSKKVSDESKSSIKDLASAKDAVSSSSEDESSDEGGDVMDDCEVPSAHHLTHTTHLYIIYVSVCLCDILMSVK